MSEVIFVDFEKQEPEDKRKSSKKLEKVHLEDPSKPERPLSAKLQRLQALIEKGLYKPDSEAIAEAIISKSELDLDQSGD